jgi:hypothetical protein
LIAYSIPCVGGEYLERNFADAHLKGTIPAIAINDPSIPVYVSSDIHEPALDRVRALARVLDTAIGIPGTKIRFGLDPIIGLVPGLGDVASAVLSGYIVLTGIRLGVSRSVVARMIANVAIDTLVGSVPVVGDLFDASWKSNQKNVALLERHMGVASSTQPRNRLLIVGGVLALVVLGIAGTVATVSVIRWLVTSIHH